MKKFYLLLLATVLSTLTAAAGDVFFYFQDGEEDDFELEYPSSFVSIWNNTTDELVQVPQDMAFMSYEVNGATMLKIYPNDLDFELAVSVDGNSDDYMLDKEDGEWYLTLFPEANGLEIYVKVYLAGQAPGGDGPSAVSMSFIVNAASGSGIDNPGEQVTVSYFDRTTFTEASVATGSGFGEAQVVPGTSFTVTPAEGYVITDISTFTYGVAYISQPGSGDTDWYISVDENPTDIFASFFITVDKASAPGDETGEVYFYFQDGEEDDFELEYPSSFVSIWNNTADELVQVPQDMAFMPFQVNGATMLKIYPNDLDFELAVNVDGDSDHYMLDKEDGEWYLTLLPGANGLEIYVKVYLAGQAPGGNDTPSDVNISFIVSTPTDSGIDNPGELVGIEYFDRNTFTDAVVTITDNFGGATVVPGTTFTINPAEGYVISDISTFTEGVATISEPAVGDTEWFLAVNENPTDNFASFFISVNKASGEGPGGEGPGGEEPGEDSFIPVINQIADLQWTFTWEDFDFITPLDSDYDQNYAYLTDEKGRRTTLRPNLHGYENATIIFPEYGNFFTLNLEGLNLADGNYMLTIPEGYLTMSHFGISTTPCPTLNLGITIGGTPDVSYDVHISDLDGNTFDISWDNVTSITENNTTGAYIRNVATGEVYEMLFLEDFMYSKANLRIYNGNSLRVNVTNNYPTLPSGTYSFYLPADYVKFNGSNTGNSAIDGYEFVYEQPWTEGRVEFNGPSEDNKLTLTWIDATEILYDTTYPGDGESIRGITIFDGNDNPVNVPYSTNIAISGNTMTIDLNGLKIAEGNCLVLVPEDCLFVTVNGVTDYTFGVSFVFTYGNGNPDGPTGPELYNAEAIWSIKSGDTVKAGTLVEVGWGDMQLNFVEDAEQASIHAFVTGILYLDYGTEVYLSEDKTRILLDLSNMPNGEFRVNVPEACVEFEVDGVKYLNQASSMDNVYIDNRSGILGITADADGHYRVVSITGVVVLDTDNAADLLGLARGFYIVNGKKVLIK